MESRLWDYIDGLCRESERKEIEQLIQTDLLWQAKYAELCEINQIAKMSELEIPSLRFSKNVMEEIARVHMAKPTLQYINKKIVFGISAFFFILIGGMLIYLLAGTHWSGASGTATKVISSWNLTQYLNRQVLMIIMFVNLILGLYLLDRYLGRKKKIQLH